MELAGRVALETGAGRRVGQAIAVALGEHGARVAVHFNESRAGADQTADRIRAHGSDARVFAADLRGVAACERLVDVVAGAFGGLDILVNSAAVMPRMAIGEVTAAEWDGLFALNLRAPFFLAQAAAKVMVERGGGAVVNIADLALYPAADMSEGVVALWVAGEADADRALAEVAALGYPVARA